MLHFKQNYHKKEGDNTCPIKINHELRNLIAEQSILQKRKLKLHNCGVHTKVFNFASWMIKNMA
jgi:hypothetical protein